MGIEGRRPGGQDSLGRPGGARHRRARCRSRFQPPPPYCFFPAPAWPLARARHWQCHRFPRRQSPSVSVGRAPIRLRQRAAVRVCGCRLRPVAAVLPTRRGFTGSCLEWGPVDPGRVSVRARRRVPLRRGRLPGCFARGRHRDARCGQCPARLPGQGCERSLRLRRRGVDLQDPSQTQRFREVEPYRRGPVSLQPGGLVQHVGLGPDPRRQHLLRSDGDPFRSEAKPDLGLVGLGRGMSDAAADGGVRPALGSGIHQMVHLARNRDRLVMDDRRKLRGDDAADAGNESFASGRRPRQQPARPGRRRQSSFVDNRFARCLFDLAPRHIPVPRNVRPRTSVHAELCSADWIGQLPASEPDLDRRGIAARGWRFAPQTAFSHPVGWLHTAGCDRCDQLLNAPHRCRRHALLACVAIAASLSQVDGSHRVLLCSRGLEHQHVRADVR